MNILFGIDMNENARKELVDLANAKMPYGKYEGYYLVKLPEAYLVWYRQKGFPTGKLGQRMEQILEIKINGLEKLIYPLIRNS